MPSASQIIFFSSGLRFTLSNKKAINQWLLDAISKEEYRLQSLNIIFCSDAYLYKLNNTFLKHKTYTDIITFDNSGESKKGKQKSNKEIEGELYISVDRVRENAKSMGISFSQELRRVFIHGALHLMGYNDKTPAQRKKMRKMEDWYLKEGLKH